MPVSLSIKNVPDRVVARLRERAKLNRRSLQGELLTMLEEGVGGAQITVEALAARVRASGLRTPAESARMIREDRDAR